MARAVTMRIAWVPDQLFLAHEDPETFEHPGNGTWKTLAEPHSPKTSGTLNIPTPQSPKAPKPQSPNPEVPKV